MLSLQKARSSDARPPFLKKGKEIQTQKTPMGLINSKQSKMAIGASVPANRNTRSA